MGKYVSVVSRTACAFLCLTAAWSPANSADLGSPAGGYKDYGEPIVVPSNFFSWTGFYLGANLGYGWGNSSSFNVPGSGNGDGFNGLTGFNLEPSGWLGGVSAGYNWQTDAFLFGFEGDLGYLGIDDSERNSAAFASADYGTYGTLTARVGYAQNRYLFYAKGGFAFANIENKAGAVTGGIDDPTDSTDNDETFGGWTLGGGAEYAFNPKMSLKLEYLYADFGDTTSTNLDGDVFEHKNDIHTIKVGLNYFIQSTSAALP